MPEFKVNLGYKVRPDLQTKEQNSEPVNVTGGRVPVTKPDALSLLLRTTWWKKRTTFCNSSTDLNMCAPTKKKLKQNKKRKKKEHLVL